MKSERAWQNRALTILIVIGACLSLLFPQNAFAQRLAIHATQAEVDIWRQRAKSGPYKDDWDRILSRADAFVSNPDARWAGQTTDECFVGPKDLTRVRDRGLRDAGFVFLVTGNTTYRNAARDALLAQITVAGTDFSNTTRWCPGFSISSNHNSLNVMIWVRKLTFGYSYIRDSLTSQQRSDLDAWFLKTGIYWEAAAHGRAIQRFPNRLSDDYSSCSGGHCPGADDGRLYFGGPMSKRFSMPWDNIGMLTVAVHAEIGCLLDNAFLKDRAKRSFHEFLKFAHYPGNAGYDQRRWDWPVGGDGSGSTPQAGYAYAGTAIGTALTIADHLARAGDTSLYTFSTSDGMFGTAGGPKSFLGVLQHFAGLTNGTLLQYASNTATSDPNKLIRHFGPGGNRIEFVYIANNIFFADSAVKAAYDRPLPGSWGSGGYECRDGDWGSYPAIRFMFGRQENAVWPYPSSGREDTSPPIPPKNLTIITK